MDGWVVFKSLYSTGSERSFLTLHCFPKWQTQDYKHRIFGWGVTQSQNGLHWKGPSEITYSSPLHTWLGNCINFVHLISLLHKISSVANKFIAELVQIFWGNWLYWNLVCFHRLHCFNLLNNSWYVIKQLSLTYFFLLEYDTRSIACMWHCLNLIYREKNDTFFH